MRQDPQGGDRRGEALRGFPTYGRGPFEAIGIETTVPLIAGFLVVCAVEIVAGVGLWVGKRWGSWLALALLPVELAYWFGFALPIALILGVARTGFVVADMATDRPASAT